MYSVDVGVYLIYITYFDFVYAFCNVLFASTPEISAVKQHQPNHNGRLACALSAAVAESSVPPKRPSRYSSQKLKQLAQYFLPSP